MSFCAAPSQRGGASHLHVAEIPPTMPTAEQKSAYHHICY